MLAEGVRALLAVDSVDLVLVREGRAPVPAAAPSDATGAPVQPALALEREHRPWVVGPGCIYVPLWDEQHLLALLRLHRAPRLRRWQCAALTQVQPLLATAVARGSYLRELEERSVLHRRMVDMAQEGIWLAGAHDETVFVNTRMAEMLGYRPEEMIGRPVYDFLPPDQRPRTSKHLECERRGEVRKTDVRLLRRDGSELWAFVSAGPVSADDGSRLGALALVTDISERKRGEAALRESEARLRQVVEQLPGVVWTVDRDLRVTSVGGAGLEFMARQPSDMLGRTGPEIVGDEDPLHALVRRALAGEPVLTEGCWFGRLYQVRLEPLRNAAGEVTGCLGVSWDITDLRRSQLELERERERARVILESIGDGVIATDPEGRIVYLNPAAEASTGWPEAEALGQPAETVFRLASETSGHSLAGELREALRGGARFRLPPLSVLFSRDGHQVPVEDSFAPIVDNAGGRLGSVLVFHDVSESRQLAAQLRHQASHDALTGLPNRDLLLDRLEQGLRHAERRRGRLALLFLDLDRFKHINDTLGHALGDELLKHVSERLREAVRRTDTVSRLGGDEFVVLLAHLERVEDATDLAEKLTDAIAQPFCLGGHELHVTTSLGIALFPEDGSSSESLLQQADIAMYHAKESGRNAFRFYTPDMNRRAAERLFLEHSLSRVLERGELAVYYQPQIDLRTGHAVGVEALLRWQHPRYGAIEPERFIPVAEDTGTILEIGEWVLTEACRQAQAWQRQGLPVRVAVNVSAVQFARADAVALVTRVLGATGLAPDQLELELTETVVMRDAEHAAQRLGALKALGVRVAVDDFGTGYSSLSYLKAFPLDSLKIDRSFVRDLATDPSDAAIATAIIRMAHSLRLTVTAEGVESAVAQAFLAAQGCDSGQGHFFGSPRPAAEVEALLRERG